MKYQFGTQAKGQPFYDDAGYKILEDFNQYRTHWVNIGQEVPTISIADYLEFLGEDDVNFPGMQTIGYNAFRDLHRDKKIILATDPRQTASPEIVLMQQQGMGNILKTPSLHLLEKDRLAIATLIQLEPADYLYARCANVRTYGDADPMKSITYKPAYGKDSLKGFVVFEKEFMDIYLGARERAILALAAAKPASSKSWRVPNTP